MATIANSDLIDTDSSYVDNPLVLVANDRKSRASKPTSRSNSRTGWLDRIRSTSRGREDLTTVGLEDKDDEADRSSPAGRPQRKSRVIRRDEDSEDEKPHRESRAVHDSDFEDESLSLVMNGHPWGRLFGSLIKDNAIMARKLKLEERDVAQLCTEFTQGLNHMVKIGQRAADQVKKDIEEDLIQQELGSAASCLGVCAPTDFAKEQVLRTSKQRSDALQQFMPTKRQFSGQVAAQEGSTFTLEEYLEGLNRAQKRERLSRTEFEDILLSSSTGTAHQMIFSLIRKHLPIEEIYKALSLNFDRRMHPDVAKTQLGSLRAAKNQTLANIEARIMKLAQRSSELIPEGRSRTQVYEIDAGTALLRALPPTSRTLATNTYQALSARLRRIPDYHELVQSLDRYAVTINQDIKANGVSEKGQDRQEGGAPSKKKGFQRRGQKEVGQYKATTFFVAPPEPSGRQRNSQNAVGGQGGAKSGQPHMSQNSPHHSSSSGGRSGQPPRQSRGGGNNQRNGKQSWKGAQGAASSSLPYCSLCGSVEHTAASGCDRMRNNSGAVVKVMPTQTSCNLCPTAVSPRLQHPEALCPWRRGGCMAPRA